MTKETKRCIAFYLLIDMIKKEKATPMSRLFTLLKYDAYFTKFILRVVFMLAPDKVYV